VARNAGREHQPAPLARQPARDKPGLAGGREAEPGPAPVGNQALQHELRSLQHLTAAVGLAAKAGNLALQRLVAARQADQAAEPDLATRIRAASGGGEPLSAALRAPIQRALGADLSDVRIHTDAQAHNLSQAVSARAFTSGKDVFFQQGAYQPDSDEGRRMVAHELAHVVQQRNGPVAGTEAPGGVKISDPGDSFERAADNLADRAVSSSKEQPHAHG
jgi:uncharacterized protein DUF4157